MAHRVATLSHDEIVAGLVAQSSGIVPNPSRYFHKSVAFILGDEISFSTQIALLTY